MQILKINLDKIFPKVVYLNSFKGIYFF